MRRGQRIGVPWHERQRDRRDRGAKGEARQHHPEAAADTDARAAPEGEVCVLGEPLRQAVGPAVRHEGFGIREVAGAAMYHPLTHEEDRKSTRLNSSHGYISYAVFCLKKKKQIFATVE